MSVYTMEASFCGNGEGVYEGLHFNIESLMHIGRDCCRNLLVFCDISVDAPIASG